MSDLGYVVSLTFAVHDPERAKSIALQVLRMARHIKELEPEATSIAPEAALLTVQKVLCGLRIDRDHRCLRPVGHAGDHFPDVGSK